MATDPAGLAWEGHPLAPSLEQVVLLSQRRDGAEATIYLYRSAADSSGHQRVAPHVHESFDDISYVLGGSATVTIEGWGSIQLAKGHFLRVPAGARHTVEAISPDFMALNIFAPPRE